MLNIFKKKWVIYGIIAMIIIGLLASFVFKPSEDEEYVLATVESGDITQTVTATGSIKADPTIDLHFEKNGKVSEILVEEGEAVEEGQLLASLENETLALEIRRNKANIALATAQYNQIKSGNTAEEIRIAESDVESARAMLEAAEAERQNARDINIANIELAQLSYNQAEDTMQAAEKDLKTTKQIAENELQKIDLSENSVNTQTVALESAYLQARTSLELVFTSTQEAVFLADEIIDELSNGAVLVPSLAKLDKSYFVPAKADYDAALELQSTLTINSSDEEIDAVIAATLQSGGSALVLLSQTGAVLQSDTFKSSEQEGNILEITTLSSKLSTATLALRELQTAILNIKTGSSQDVETVTLTYQRQIDAAESTYETAVNSFEKAEFDLEQAKINAENSNTNAEANVAIQRATLDAAEANLALKKSPVRQTDLAPLLAQISLAEIALEMAEEEAEGSQLVAPMNGVVSFIHGKVGENISISETALSSFLTLQADELLVEANIPETDISKIRVGDKVVMTIDAFDFTEKFDGTVAYIDYAETVIQGVVYYQIKAAFDLGDERLKSGMTTNLEIITAEKENVLIVPARAINYEDSTRYVEVLRDGSPEKVEITTGLESDQFVEITSGLEEGDQIITFVR